MARKVLVSLVSDQTIPIVLLAKELSDIDFYIFVTTKKMEENKRSDHTILALGLADNQFLKIRVQEDSLIDISENLKNKLSSNDEYIVNLTGGTKLMSIGSFNFFKKKNSVIYYIAGGKNTYRQIYPEINNKEKNLNYRANIKEYLRSYGIEIHKKSFNNKNNLLKSEEYTRTVFIKYTSNQIDFQFLDELRKIRKISKFIITDLFGLEEFLTNIEFKTINPGFIVKKEIEYLTGGWFEEFIYQKIMQKYNFEDEIDMIGINVTISNQKLQNEFDIMYMFKNRLHVIECKTGIFDSITNRNITNDAIYKLAALKKYFGLFAKTEFYTLSEKGNSVYELKQNYLDRANILSIEIKDKNDILNQN
jgi:hypothetical protein